MKSKVEIKSIKTIYDIDGYWSNEDYIALLDAMNFPDAEDSSPDELRDLLFMAMSDFEPHEAAEIVLAYQLGDRLQKGQIENMSFEMIEDSLAEEYSDISLHFDLFNINRLLHQGFNGTFPNTKATQLQMQISLIPPSSEPLTKEWVLKALSYGLSDRNLIKRLFEAQLKGKAEFAEADSIIWDMELGEGGHISLITSDYWINREDLVADEFEGMIHLFEPEED